MTLDASHDVLREAQYYLHTLPLRQLVATMTLTGPSSHWRSRCPPIRHFLIGVLDAPRRTTRFMVATMTQERDYLTSMYDCKICMNWQTGNRSIYNKVIQIQGVRSMRQPQHVQSRSPASPLTLHNSLLQMKVRGERWTWYVYGGSSHAPAVAVSGRPGVTHYSRGVRAPPG